MSGLAGDGASAWPGALALGGVGALASRNEEVIRKWRTWMVAAPLAPGACGSAPPGATLLAAGLGVTGAIEYGRLARLADRDSALWRRSPWSCRWSPGGLPADLGRALAAALLAVALVPVLGGDAADGARRAAPGFSAPAGSRH